MHFGLDLASGDLIGNDCAALRTYSASLTETEEIVIGLEQRG